MHIILVYSSAKIFVLLASAATVLLSPTSIAAAAAAPSDVVPACHDSPHFFHPDEWVYCQQLTSTLFMYYTPLEEEEGNLMLGLHAVNETYGWTALAVAGNGGMKGASQIVVRKQQQQQENNNNDEWIAEDRNSQDYTTPSLDESQDVKLLFANQTTDDKGETAWGVLLMMNSCDPLDYPILNVSVFMHWALGDSHTFGYHGSRRGQFHANLRQAPTEAPSTDGLDFIDIRMPNVSVVLGDGGSDPTNPYICSFFDLQVLGAGRFDVNDKVHVTRLAPVLNEASKQYVHHMILYTCLSAADREESGGNGDNEAGVNFTTVEHLQIIPECESMPEGCYEIKWPWAVGSEEIVFPEDVGLPIGEGQRWLVLQVHYYNPNLDEGVTDSSGVRAYVSSDLREQDAGVMELNGGTNQWQHPAIPARVPDFALPSFVLPSECTSSVWDTPLTILGIIHHMHLYGTKMEIIVQRDRRNLGPLRNEHHYDFLHQSLEPATGVTSLLPGDVISVNCFYDTSNANQNVSFGDLTQQEMCYGAIMYYPKQREQSFGFLPPAEDKIAACTSPGTGNWAQASACAQSFYENVPAFFGFEDQVEAPYDAWTMCNSDWFETDILPFVRNIDLCPDCYLNNTCTPEEVGIHAQTVFCSQFCGEAGLSVYPDTSRTDIFTAGSWGCPQEYFDAPEIVDPAACEKVGNLGMHDKEEDGDIVNEEGGDHDSGVDEEKAPDTSGGAEMASSVNGAKSIWNSAVVLSIVLISWLKSFCY